MSERLRFVFHERLARYLFPGQEREFRSLALKYISGALPKEGDLFVFTPARIGDLEKNLSELRSYFEKTIKEAPFPFTLVPELMSSAWVRPGKIYLSPRLRDEVEKKAKELGFLISFSPYREFLEVATPSTADPEVLFKTRDLLWVGGKEACFYCGLPWHKSSDCPGLREAVSGKALKDYMYKSLDALAKTLNERLLAGDLKSEALNGLYCRYFYLLPAFLKVLFYKTHEWSSFSQVSLGKEIMGRGGTLLIALENLFMKNFSEAEKKFFESGPPSDYRVGLGLCHLSILQGDYERAIYYLEEIHFENLVPLIQATILFIKGRIAEIQNDYIQAESLYGDALKRDSSFVPAAYHKLLVSFSLGGTERTVARISHFLGHPVLFALSFLEPAFIPFSRELEKELQSRIEKKQAEALARLREAEDGLHKLKHVLSEEELSSLEDQISRLRESIYKGAFFELEMASVGAAEMALEIKGYTYRKIRDLKERVLEYHSRYVELKRYWNRYPYKHGEYAFERYLKEVWDRIQRLEERLKRDPAKELKVLLKEMENLERLFERINREKERLEAKAAFRRQLNFFIKVFVFGEVLLFLLFFSLPSFVAVVAPEILPHLPFNLSTFVVFSVLILILALVLSLFKR